MNEKVYVAMAGQHQIWEYNVLDGITRVFSGNGYERNLNGSTYVYTNCYFNNLTCVGFSYATFCVYAALRLHHLLSLRESQ